MDDEKIGKIRLAVSVAWIVLSIMRFIKKKKKHLIMLAITVESSYVILVSFVIAIKYRDLYRKSFA